MPEMTKPSTHLQNAYQASDNRCIEACDLKSTMRKLHRRPDFLNGTRMPSCAICLAITNSCGCKAESSKQSSLSPSLSKNAIAEACCAPAKCQGMKRWGRRGRALPATPVSKHTTRTVVFSCLRDVHLKELPQLHVRIHEQKLKSSLRNRYNTKQRSES